MCFSQGTCWARTAAVTLGTSSARLYGLCQSRSLRRMKRTHPPPSFPSEIVPLCSNTDARYLAKCCAVDGNALINFSTDMPLPKRRISADSRPLQNFYLISSALGPTWRGQTLHNSTTVFPFGYSLSILTLTKPSCRNIADSIDTEGKTRWLLAP